MMNFRNNYSPIDLSTDMPPDLTRDQQLIFSRVYRRVIAETQSSVKALCAAMGSVKRLQLGMAIKSANVSVYSNLIGGWGVRFGSPDEVDDYGEYFTPKTDLHLKRGAHYPLYYAHNPALKMGYVDSWQVYPYGVWFRARVTHPDHKRAVLTDVANGIFTYSTGSPVRDRKVARNGEIIEHPVWELSIVENPAELSLGSVIVDIER